MSIQMCRLAAPGVALTGESVKGQRHFKSQGKITLVTETQVVGVFAIPSVRIAFALSGIRLVGVRRG